MRTYKLRDVKSFVLRAAVKVDYCELKCLEQNASFRYHLDSGQFCELTVVWRTHCLFQIKFITEYTNVQHGIITQIL